jgi:hypothetical protein
VVTVTASLIKIARKHNSTFTAPAGISKLGSSQQHTDRKTTKITELRAFFCLFKGAMAGKKLT